MKASYILVITLAILMLASLYLGFTPLAASILLAALSLAAYTLYAKDKTAAQTYGWRVSERTLHTVALLGGWPGAMIAQKRLRHKTKKASFRTVFWLTVLVNSAGIAWLHTPKGNTQLREGLVTLEQAAISSIHQDTALELILLTTQLRHRPERTQ
ncbi:DUF1294 domain-containing protein [Marinimicrobium sp. C6131]|uniref:DUF1294 domain-containing protein n=1 Tax=Marinimicrobium sp. C6131 TaxID=3022676 RepID=UPI00223D187B|nr:DUF1294 domain-containing protein [Marinimicrobium sp. C6131]UZJ46010.1 DUF1294 domain-containing protein [Marinimicrobium sp. C6131]